MISKLTLPNLRTLLSFTCFLPIVILIIFVANFGENVPYWDQWNVVGLFEKISTGTASFGDFFTQNNEHRLAFPLLIIVPLAFISKWDVRYELYTSIFLAAITFLVIYKLSSIHRKNGHNKLDYLTFLTSLLIFSLAQYQNWLWGFQLAWFLVNLCLVIAVLIITLSNNNSQRIYLAAIPCFIASFSLAHGLLTWLAVIPSIASIKGTKNRVITISIWLSLFVGTSALYFTDYQKPAHKVNTLFFLKEPLRAGKYFFTLLGTPLIHKDTITPIIGLIIFLTFFVLTLCSLKISESKFEIKLEAAPWISIGLFALLFALITTVGRASLGVEQAMVSRYTTPSVLLIISTAYLWQLFVSKNVFITGIITGFIIINSVDAITQARILQLQRQVSTNCLELINFIDKSSDSCLAELYPSTSALREFAEVLERINFRKFPKDIAFIAEPGKVHGYVDSPPVEGGSCTLSKSKSVNARGWTVRPDGYIELPATAGSPCTISKSGSVNMAGWAILPDSRELPKTVLFSHGNNRLFFANAVVNLDSPDVAKAFNSSRYSKVRWAVNIPSKSLPLGDILIKAWVYDPSSQQVVKLNGEPKIKVVE